MCKMLKEGVLLLLLTSSWSSGVLLRPSKLYLKSLQNEDAHAPLLPLEAAGSGSGNNGETCSSNSLQDIIAKLQRLAVDCIHMLEFNNCCEPKFLNYVGSTIFPLRLQILSKRSTNYFAYCDLQTNGGGWMVIMRRGFRYYRKKKTRPTSGPLPREYSARGYRAYELGFGVLNRDFWAGLHPVHYFTNTKEGVELRIEVKRDEMAFFAHYNNFSLGDWTTGYTFHIDGYRNESTLPNSLAHNNGFPFFHWSNFSSEVEHCNYLFGSWWLGKKGNETCTKVGLFGREEEKVWEMNHGKVNFSYVEMKIRPKTWECSEDAKKRPLLYPVYT